MLSGAATFNRVSVDWWKKEEIMAGVAIANRVFSAMCTKFGVSFFSVMCGGDFRFFSFNCSTDFLQSRFSGVWRKESLFSAGCVTEKKTMVGT